MNEDGYYGHDRSVREYEMRVPLVIRPPGDGSGSRIALPVLVTDLTPSVLVATGSDLGGTRLDGIDLASAAALGERTIHFQRRFDESAWSVTTRGRWSLERAARQGGWKYVVAPRGRALHDVRVDPLERRDLSHQQPEVARRLSESLRDWSEQPVTPFTPSDLEELRESLRALGYVD